MEGRRNLPLPSVPSTDSVEEVAKSRILPFGVGIPWTCYRGHLGPFGPKMQNSPKISSRGRSPKRSRKKVEIVEKQSILILFLWG